MDDDELTSLLRAAMTGAACFVNIGGTWVGATDSPATESANDPAWRSDHPFPSSVPKNAQTGALYARIAQSHRATATSLTPKRHAAFRPTRTLIPRCQNDHPPTPPYVDRSEPDRPYPDWGAGCVVSAILR